MALCSTSSHFSVYSYYIFFFLPFIPSLLFSLSLASSENGLMSWAEAILAANCPCNRREPVGRSKSEEARCCLKPVTWANIHWLRAWAVHVSCLQHQAEASVVFHPLGRACHGCHKSSTNLNTYHSRAAVPDRTASSVPPWGLFWVGVDPPAPIYTSCELVPQGHSPINLEGWFFFCWGRWKWT